MISRQAARFRTWTPSSETTMSLTFARGANLRTRTKILDCRGFDSSCTEVRTCEACSDSTLLYKSRSGSDRLTRDRGRINEGRVKYMFV